MSVRVLVADDQDLVRGGIVALLTAAPGLEVAGEARDGLEAVTLAGTTRPDVVLMDVRMPRLDGISAMRTILAAGEPRPAVIVLTTFDLDEYVYAALRDGASGFLLKDTPPRRIVSAVEAVAEGEILLSPGITRRLVETYSSQPAHRAADPAGRHGLDLLTVRETEILGLVGSGLTNADIAGELVVSEETVKTHVKRVMSKLQLRSRAQAVVVAYETGLRQPGPRSGPSRG